MDTIASGIGAGNVQQMLSEVGDPHGGALVMWQLAFGSAVQDRFFLPPLRYSQSSRVAHLRLLLSSSENGTSADLLMVQVGVGRSIEQVALASAIRAGPTGALIPGAAEQPLLLQRSQFRASETVPRADRGLSTRINCNTASRRMHIRCFRELADLPLQRIPVVVPLQPRRFLRIA